MSLAPEDEEYGITDEEINNSDNQSRIQNKGGEKEISVSDRETDETDTTDETESKARGGRISVSPVSSVSSTNLSVTDNLEFVGMFNKQDKMLLYYYDHPNGLSDAEIAQFCGFENKYVATFRKRHGDKIIILSDGRPRKYGISANDRIDISAKYKEFLDRQKKSSQNIAQKLQEMQVKEQQENKIIRQTESLQDYVKLLADEGVSHNILVFDYERLLEHDIELADLMIDDYVSFCQMLKIAVSNIDGWERKHFQSRVVNLPDSCRRSVKHLRCADIHKLCWSYVELEGITDVRPLVDFVRYECPSCGNVLNVLQVDESLKQPTTCACGRKGKFKQIDKRLSDSAYATVMQPLDEYLTDSGNRSRAEALILGELASPDIMQGLGTGSRLKIIYHLEEQAIYARNGVLTRRVDFLLNILHFEKMDYKNVHISIDSYKKSEFEQCAALKDWPQQLAENIYHQHCGDANVKLACAAQLFAGDFADRCKREQYHIMLIGDPGTGKTNNFLRRAITISPLGKFFQAATGSKVGLTGAAGMKDKHTERRYPEPGAISQANKGILALDELNALEPEESKALNEGLEEGTITLRKQGIDIIMPADVRVIAACNPKSGRLMNLKLTYDELGFDPSLLDRFSFIFIMYDSINYENDLNICARINGDYEEPRFDDAWLREYIIYARDNVRPVLRKQDAQYLLKLYCAIRQLYKVQMQDSCKPLLPVGHRQYKGLCALTLCIAKMLLKHHTDEQCVKYAVDTVYMPILKSLQYDMNKLKVIA